MIDIKTIRLGTGLTQEGFAMLLGITRAQLSMAESKRRLLPLRALLKLQAVVDTQEELSAPQPKQAAHNAQPMKHWLKKRKRHFESNLRAAQRLLINLRQQQQCAKFVQCFHRQQQTTADEQLEHRMLKLEIRIIGLEAQIEAMERRLENGEN